MDEVTAQLARPIGLDSFADLTAVKPLPPTSNADGTATVCFPDGIDAATLAAVRDRMTTANDAELAQRLAIRAALAALIAQAPLPATPTDADRLAWLVERATLQDALLLPLASLFGMTPE